jgi:hypothetical protein
MATQAAGPVIARPTQEECIHIQVHTYTYPGRARPRPARAPPPPRRAAPGRGAHMERGGSGRGPLLTVSPAPRHARQAASVAAQARLRVCHAQNTSAPRKKERPTPISRRALRGHSSMRTTDTHTSSTSASRARPTSAPLQPQSLHPLLPLLAARPPHRPSTRHTPSRPQRRRAPHAGTYKYRRVDGLNHIASHHLQARVQRSLAHVQVAEDNPAGRPSPRAVV